MITKEIAALIYHCYNEIEQAEKMVTELKKSLNEKGQFEILELHLPTSMSGATIKRVPFELALAVIENHVVAQQKELERLKDVCKIQLS